MEIQALTRNARMSPRKVREIANQIQGRPVPEAIDFLTLIPRKSARLLAKTLTRESQPRALEEAGGEPA